MDFSILYDDTSGDGHDRIAGVYGKDLGHSEKYSDLRQLSVSETELWDKIMDYTPYEEFATFNIEEFFFDQVAVTVSDGRVTRTQTYKEIDGEPAKVPEKGDEEILQKYIEDALQPQDLNRLREQNLRGIDGKLDNDFFDGLDKLNPEEGFR